MTVTLPVVLIPVRLTFQSPVVVVSDMFPLPVAPETLAPLDSVMNTSPVPAPAKLICAPAVSNSLPDAPRSPSAPPAVKVSVPPVMSAAAPLRRMSPALAVMVTFPVVSTPVEFTVQSPVVEVRTMFPVAAEPLTFAPSVSVMTTSPVPVAVKTIELPEVSNAVPVTPTSPSAPPAVKVSVLPVTSAVAPLRKMSPALAMSVTSPVASTPVKLIVQLFVEVMSVVLPEPFAPVTVAPSVSVMNVSPVPVPANAIAVPVVRSALPDAPRSPSAPPAVSVSVVPVMSAATPLRRMSPADAVIFTVPEASTPVELIVQSPVVVVSVIFPAVALLVTFAPFASVIN